MHAGLCPEGPYTDNFDPAAFFKCCDDFLISAEPVFFSGPPGDRRDQPFNDQNFFFQRKCLVHMFFGTGGAAAGKTDPAGG